ncbi:TAP-like protein-domain-containing protein [Trametes elegans]|nr:TAP-like protein-domain-containing protein [Trametes elegans]
MTDYYHGGGDVEKTPLYGPLPSAVPKQSKRSAWMKWIERTALVVVFVYLASSTVFKESSNGGSNAAKPEKCLRIGDITWALCKGQDYLPGSECGTATVPLDYSNPSAGTATIALGRYNATGSTRRGIIILNPGGPGGTGTNLATISGARYQGLVGNEFDMIGFDPRGIGETTPRTQCFPSPEAHAAFIANTVLDRGYDVNPNLTDPFTRAHLIAQQRDANALWKTQFEICNETMGDTLRYAGTNTVVRDIDYLTTLLEGEDALINYYGISYGTVIGQYLVNMFPNRVGRVAIDGVVDANLWANVPAYKWERYFENSTDDAYKTFISDCAQAIQGSCALANGDDEKPDDLMARVESFVEGLYYEPLPVPDAKVPGILTNGRARLWLLGVIARPSTWPTKAQYLAWALAGNASALLDDLQSGTYLRDLERSAVSCNDNKPFDPPTPEEIIDEQLDVLKTVSRFSLSMVVSEPDAGCQYWPVTPPERFLGPWNHTLSNVMLIISNTMDPATPLSAGRRVNEALGNSSRLLIQESPGHASVALPSTCTIGYMRGYFANGTLPDNETKCPVDVGPFPSFGATSKVFTEEEKLMLESARHIAEVVLNH